MSTLAILFWISLSAPDYVLAASGNKQVEKVQLNRQPRIKKVIKQKTRTKVATSSAPKDRFMLIKIFLGAVILIFFFAHSRQFSFLGGAQRARGHRFRLKRTQPKPLRLEPPSSPDPWTIRFTSQVEQPFKSDKDVADVEVEAQKVFHDDILVPEISLDTPQNAIGMLEIDPGPETRQTFKVKGDHHQDPSGKSKTKRGQENKLIETSFNLPLVCRGQFVLTNKRVIARYQRLYWQILPPKITTQGRKHQISLKRLTDAAKIEKKRPLLLVPALLLFWWSPLGTAAAMVFLAMFFIFTRAELLILTDNGHEKTYPLAPQEVHRVLTTIENLQIRQQQEKKLEKTKKKENQAG